MAWKTVKTMEALATSTFYLGTNEVRGKHIRVTLEEEVGECCEKWRGLLGGSPKFTDGTAWLQIFVGGQAGYHLHGPVVYCPTCGKKLL